jgi:hypothetical protein
VFTSSNSGSAFNAVIIDDLAFTPTPEPATIGLVTVGFAGLAALRRIRRRAS